MFKHFTSLAVFLMFCVALNAATGDTTTIVAIDSAQMASPPSNDDAWVIFPDGSAEYQRINMKFTLGCGVPNCSGWDYTVTLSIGKHTWTYDSTIAAIDTLTNDTTWNVFEVIKWYEIGRMITPYGTYMANNSNGFNNSWTHPYYYDVTDFAQLLRDSVLVRIHYDGWTDAFRGRVIFDLIEGPRNRVVENVQTLYNTYAGYPNSGTFENQINAVTFNVPANVTSSKLILILTGHGSQGEFDPHSIHVKVNSTEVYTRLMWRGDCGLNPIFPQGGTWIFNRANWCPGDKVQTIEFDLTPYVTPGQNVTIDLDMDDYVVQSGQGAGYGIASYFVTYTSEFNNDAMLEDIMAPNRDKPHLRWNPVCSNPKVRVKNTGKNMLSYFEIAYWGNGTDTCWFEWAGAVKPFESVDVTLPLFDWSGLDTNNREFHARVGWPNQMPDEYELNNHLSVPFNMPPVLDSVFIISMRTNDHPEETSGWLKRENGTPVFQYSNLSANTIYRDTVHLEPGCYIYQLNDYDSQWEGGDGLSWWLNQQQGWEVTTGHLQFRRLNNTLFKSFNMDFGNMIYYEFMVGYPLGGAPDEPACVKPVHSGTGELQPLMDRLEVFPNPSTGSVTIRFNLEQNSDGQLQIFDMTGITVFEQPLRHRPNGELNLLLEKQGTGLYYAVLQTSNGKQIQKISIVR